jgi:hypothetical protein
MTDTHRFVRKRAKKLPIKYIKRSINSLFGRDILAGDIESLEAIEDQFNRFIKTPVS